MTHDKASPPFRPAGRPPVAGRRPFLAALVVVLVLATVGCAMVQQVVDIQSSPEFASLSEAFSQRVNPDDSILNAAMTVEVSAGNGSEMVSLIYELYITDPCRAAQADPCQKLADELVEMTFAAYGDAPAFTHIRLAIASGCSVEIDEPKCSDSFDRQLPIAEWRQELAARQNQ